MGAPWLGAVCVLGLGAASYPFTVDDAYITARYAEQICAGNGYAFSGSLPSDGVTGPLWLVPGLVACVLGLDPLWVAKLLGLALSACGAAVPVAALRRRAGGRIAAWVAAALIGVQSSLAIWGVAGLETGAATCAMSVAVVAALRRPTPGAWRVGGGICALAWLRPELALASGVLLAFVWLRDRKVGQRAFVAACAGAASVVLWRLSMFDHALPLSLAAKPAELDHGLAYSLRSALLVSGVGGLLLVASAAVRGGRDGRMLAWLLLAHWTALVLCGGDWMPGFRLAAPLLPAYGLAAGLGLSRLRGTRPQRLVASVALCSALLATGLESWSSIVDARASAQPRLQVGPALLSFLAEQPGPVALVDIGFLGRGSDREVLDLGGLTDPEIARLPGGHLDKRVDAALLARREPGVLLLHSSRPPRVSAQGRLEALWGYPVEQRIAASPWVRRNYVVERVFAYHSSYYYVALVRSWEEPPKAPHQSGR